MYERAAASEEVCDLKMAVMGVFICSSFFGEEVSLFKIFDRYGSGLGGGFCFDVSCVVECMLECLAALAFVSVVLLFPLLSVSVVINIVILTGVLFAGGFLSLS